MQINKYYKLNLFYKKLLRLLADLIDLIKLFNKN